MTENKAGQMADERNIKNAFYFGVRFDGREFQTGDRINNSKTNTSRDDTRDFPEYGTPEYKALSELDGVCAYNLKAIDTDNLDNRNWYLIGGDKISYGEDEDEVILHNAVVICKL